MKTTTRQMAISKIYRRATNINLDAFFQREKVWPISYQQYFIDTILKRWGTPKIYLAVTKDQQKRENYICVDGKQRLITIFSFLKEKGLKLSKDKKYPAEFRGKSYGELLGPIQDKINDYKITVELVSDYNDQELGELFKRLQHGRSINSAEKLRANNNEMTRFIDALTKQKFFTHRVSLPNTRYAHFAVATQLCHLEIAGRIVNAKYNDLEKFLKAYSEFNNRGDLAKRIQNILKYLSRMFKDKAPELSNRANIVSIFLLISDLMKRGNIKGKEHNLSTFFKKFNKEMKEVVTKDSATGDASFFRYQSATIQAADSLTSIRTRHEILCQKLVNYSPFFKQLLNIFTNEEEFKQLYDNLERQHGGSPNKFNEWLLNTYPTIETIQCKNGIETLPVHVRHSMHHPDHPKYTKSQLVKALKLLRGISE